MGDVMVAPLKANGYSLNSVDPKELEVVRTELLELAPHVLALNSDTYEVPIQNEEAVLGLTWTGGVVELREEEETKDVEYIVPEDGTLYWMDTWVIFDEAPHPNAAHAFLNFIHDPQIQAQETITNRYATPNDEAKKYVRRRSSTTRRCSCRRRSSTRACSRARRTPRRDPLRNEIWEEFRSKIGRRNRPRARARARCEPMTTAEATVAPPRAAPRAREPAAAAARPVGARHALLAGAGLWYLLLLVRRSSIVILFSFGNRTKNGGYDGGFTLDNFADRLGIPGPVPDEPRAGGRGHDPVPARGAAARLLHRDAGRPPQEPADHPARDPVLDELPDPDLLVADHPRARRAPRGSSAT